jgi:hypothetical protein
MNSRPVDIFGIEQALARLRASARAFLVVRRGGLIVAGAVAVALGIGFLDYTLRLPQAARVVLWLAGVAWLAWAVRRHLAPALRFKPTLSQVALRVEQSPAGKAAGLEGVLTSAVELAPQAESHVDAMSSRGRWSRMWNPNLPGEEPPVAKRAEVVAVSPTQRALASATVEDALERFATMKFSIPRLLHGIGLRKPLLALTAVTAVLSILSISHPTLLSVGVRRVLTPWVEARWPRTTGVQPAETPMAHAYGSAFPLRAVLTKSKRPAEQTQVTARYRAVVDGNAEAWRTVVLTPQGRNVLIDPGLGAPPVSGALFERLVETTGLLPGDAAARRDHKVELEYAFASQDDATETLRVLLLEPPTIGSSRVEVTPPEYARGIVGALEGLAQGTIDSGQGLDARSSIGPVLAGSRVRLQLEVEGMIPTPSADAKSEATAAWLRDVFPGLAGGESPATDLTWAIDEKSKTWTLAFTAEKPVRSSVVLKDRFGIASRDEPAFRFETVEDRPPTAAVIDPPQDEGVLSTAVVAVAGEGRDDVALARVVLTAQTARNQSESPGAVLDAAGEASVLASVDLSGSGPRVEGSEEGVLDGMPRRVSVRRTLDIATTDARVGDEVWITAASVDAFSKSRVVESGKRRLRIISETEFVEGLRSDLKTLRDAARQLEREQGNLARAREQLEDRLAQDTGKTAQERGRDAQAAAELTQGQNSLARRAAPFSETLEKLSQRAERNRLSDEALTGLLRDATETADAAREAAGAAQQALAEAERSARQAAEQSNPGSAAARNSAQAASRAAAQSAEQQARAQQELSQLAQMLDQNQDEWAVRREIERLLTEQKQARQQTQNAGQQTGGKDASDLTQQQRDDLERVARKQDELAARTAQALEKLEERAGALESADPALSQALRQSAARARQQQVTDKQRQAAGQVRQNQTGLAQQLQQQAEQALQEALDSMEQTQQARDERLQRVLAEVVQALELLITQQSDHLALVGKAIDAGAAAPGLDKGIIAINQNTLGLAERVRGERGNNEDILEYLGSAGEAQASAAVALRAASPDLSEAEELERVSLARLRDALAAAQEKQDDAAEREAQRKKRELRRAYTELLEAQAGVRADAGEIAGEEENRKTRARARALSLTQEELLAKLEAVRTETDEISQARMFEFAHQRLGKTMRSASETLAEGKATQRVLREMDQSITILRGLVDALKDDPNNEKDGLADGGGGGSGGSGGSGQPPPLLPPARELMLLRGMQVEAASRTKVLEGALRETPEGTEVQAELLDVGALQQSLAEQGLELLQRVQQEGGAPPSAPKIEPEEPIGPGPTEDVAPGFVPGYQSAASKEPEKPRAEPPAKPATEPDDPSLDELLGLPSAKPAARPSAEPGKPVEGGDGPTKPKPQTPRDLDRQLETAERPEDDFAQAVSLMGDTADMLVRSRDAGVRTQRLQDEIVRKLDKIIEEAKKNSRKSKQSSSSEQQQQESNQQKQSRQRQSSQRQQQQQQQAGNQAQGGNVPQQQGELRQPPAGSEATWGNLPPRVRDALMQGSTDKFSSLYERMTQEYYKRLAEPRTVPAGPRSGTPNEREKP